ncbi:MAG TPA: LysR family transcriptional regulator [Natronosporangium sp.]
MNLAHLRYFAAVVEHGNVTRAAEALYVSQPTVSAALRSLERELGQPLFDRVGRRLRVTAAGAEAYRRVTRILAEWDDTRSSLSTDGADPGRLRLGVLETLPHQWLADLLGWLRRAHPGLATTVRTGGAARLASWLAGGRVDALLTAVEDQVPDGRVLFREPVVAVVHPDHRLARRDRITLRDLETEPFVQRDHCEIMDSGRERVRRAGVRLTLVARVRSDELALSLVRQGIGYTLAPISLATDDVATVPVDDFPIQRSVVLQVRADATPEQLRTVDRIVDYQRRASHSGIDGRSAPSVLSLP